MGSIGVNTGRVGKSETVRIEEGTSEITLGKANTIAVFPNNFSTWGSSKRGFAIAMTGASAKEKTAFIRRLRGAINSDNAERSAQKTYRDAIARGMKEGQARRAAEEKRTEVQRRLVDTIIRNSGGKFKNIRTRALTKRDYNQAKKVAR